MIAGSGNDDEGRRKKKSWTGVDSVDCEGMVSGSETAGIVAMVGW